VGEKNAEIVLAPAAAQERFRRLQEREKEVLPIDFQRAGY
jgi:hypothetical protein